MRRFLHELKRRSVHRVAVAYIAASWLLIQILETVFPIYGLDESGIRWFILALLVGFVPALGLAWAFEWSPGRIRLQADIDQNPEAAQPAGRTFDRVIIGLLSVAVLYFAVDKFLTGPLMVSESPAARTIAVLPFQDMTAAQNQAWFADGLAEELLNLLARNPALKVAARTSSFSFRNATLPIEEIARQLRVNHILEGSVRRDGDRIRVTAQLIGGEDGYHQWSQTYDTTFSDIFSIQEEISMQIARALEAKVARDVSTPRQTDPEAYALYLQARYLTKQSSRESIEEAVTLYQEALEIDPEYAPALVGLAVAYVNQTPQGHKDRDDAFREARGTALRAVQVDPTYSGGHLILAWISQFYDSDLTAAIEHMEKALQLEPEDLTILGNAAVVLLHTGKLEESIAVQEYTASLSPIDPQLLNNLGLAYKYADRLHDAERTFRKVLQLSPEYTGASYHLGETLLLMGRAEEALAVWQRLPESFNRARGLALATYALGRRDEADSALANLIREWGERWPTTVVHVHAYRGEIDQAFEWLDKEYQKFGPAGWGEYKLQRLFDNLRSDPRWTSFLERVGASAEQLSAYDFDVAIPRS